MSSSMRGSGGTVSTATSTSTNSARASTEIASIRQQQRNLRQRQHKDHDNDHNHDHSVNNEDDEDDDDPYSKQLRNCNFGDIRPQLPRLEIVQRTTTDTTTDTTGMTNTSYSMQIDYSKVSVPPKKVDRTMSYINYGPP
mmetsp:Transcript_46142/g.52385  ORF Transcript_46142/g.52385 Transcript_46142/m.52385 type:complete len:139 (-) Transcript_46142:106-522(-)